MKLYLFRHGETWQSKTHVPYGVNERTAEILPETSQVVLKIASELEKNKPEACFVSEFLRCRQTAEIIEKKTSLKFVPTPLLNEYVEGEFEDLKKRGQDFLAMCVDKKFTSVAVCTHGAVVSCLKHLFLTRSFEIDDLFDYPKAGVLLSLLGC